METYYIIIFTHKSDPQNQVKTNGAIYLSESNVNELDEEESQKATGNKKMKAAFEIETEYSNRKYILCAKSEEERDVSRSFMKFILNHSLYT